jgi:23S rRNA (guanosine2251-2'-O)-methyltransferase
MVAGYVLPALAIWKWGRGLRQAAEKIIDRLWGILSLHLFNGILYLCAMRKLSMAELGRKTVEEFRLAEKIPVIVVLENIRSAYNVGSVFRTSDAFLVEAIYIIGYSAKPPHKEIKKTALGAEETVTWKYFKTTAEAVAELRQLGYNVYAAEQAEGSFQLNAISIEPDERIAVVFGNEVTGVEQSTILLCDGCIEIPQLGMKHSLNIATAAGVVLWELVRFRV